MLYPLKFRTIFKDKIWGGSKIHTILGKDFSPLPNCGETWEISGVPGNVSVVEEGELKGKSLNELIETYKEELVGTAVWKRYGKEFPLLIKFIDANEDLSIQVHPDDDLAKTRHDSFGKTEMWYIFQADPDSSLIVGFNKDTNKEEYLKKLASGSLMDILNREKVQEGDCFFIPAGRVHTIGKGLLLAEIQQTSDVTYRIYDFDREDDKGQKRELHTEQSVDALDYKGYPEYKTAYEEKLNQATPLVQCTYFTTQLISFSTLVTRDYREKKSFVIYICFEGEAAIKTASGYYTLEMGDSYLIPASLKHVELIPKEATKVLEVFIEA